MYLIDFTQRIEKLRKFGEVDEEDKIRNKGISIIEQSEGFLYKLVFRKAVGDANEIHYNENGMFA